MPLKFLGAQVVPVPMGYSTGSSTTTVVVVYPESMAAVYTKGLIAEPGERSAFSARLYSSSPRPPTSALICPVCASIATSAAWG